ncbi:MAG TPA: ABC transporter transmembrane domain-containing protein, partial [Rectinemataceae bacterium]|nr:ABC transporter transmembrane domain-containing protein [Rectinemataceae bacterium]
MGDYFENDAVTKGYDPRIMRRIFGYLRPYRLAVAVTALALIIGTAGELILPVLVRRIVDEALMPSWYAVDPRAGLTREGRGLLLLGAGGASEPILAGRAYLRSSRLSAITGAERRSLEAQGLLDGSPRYLFRLDPGDQAQAAAVSANAERIVSGGGLASMRVDELRSLPAPEARAIRKGDRALLAANASLLFAALVVVLATAFVQTFVANLLGQRIMKDLRMELFRHTATRSLAFLSRQPVGRLVTRLTSDIETINQFFTDVVVAFIKDLSIMVGVV